MDGPMKKGDIVEFADGHTIMLGPDGLYIMGVDCQHPYNSSTPWPMPTAVPDDAKPVSAMDVTIQGIPIPPGIVNGKTHYERKKEADEELIESNRRTREEIKRILGQ